MWSLIALREKLLKTGAKVARHGRRVTFQMAEVAVRPTDMGDKVVINIKTFVDGRAPPDRVLDAMF